MVGADATVMDVRSLGGDFDASNSACRIAFGVGSILRQSLQDNAASAAAKTVTATRNAEPLVDQRGEGLFDNGGIPVDGLGGPLFVFLCGKPLRKRVVRNIVAERFPKRIELAHLTLCQIFLDEFRRNLFEIGRAQV